MSRTMLLGVLFALGCAAPASNAGLQPRPLVSRLEGTFDYVGTLKGLGILSNGRYAFLYAPPMEARR